MDNLTPQQYPTYTKKTAPFPRKILLFIIILILLGAGLLASRGLLSGKSSKEAVVVDLPTPTVTPFPTETPIPTSGSPTSGKTTATPVPTSAAKTATKQNLTVDVLNGSGIAGAASKMADYLKGLGYTIGTTGNADAFDYTNVVIQLKKSKSASLSQLKSDLASDYTVGSTSATLTESSSSDAVVIIGK